MGIEYAHTASMQLHELASGLVDKEGFEEAKALVLTWRKSCGNSDERASIVMAALCIGAMSVLEVKADEEDKSFN